MTRLRKLLLGFGHLPEYLVPKLSGTIVALQTHFLNNMLCPPLFAHFMCKSLGCEHVYLQASYPGFGGEVPKCPRLGE